MKFRRSGFPILALVALISIGYVYLPTQISPSVSVSAAAKLSAPSEITYTATTDTITLKWDPLSGADAYRVYASSEDIESTDDTKLYMIDDDIYFIYKSVKDNKCVVEGLTKGKTYRFVIAALDKNGNSYTEGTKSGVIRTKTRSVALPKAPSAGYTGTATSGGKTYYFKDGKLAKGFIKTSSGYMYFDGNTYQMKTGLVTTGGATYYFGNDGIMYTSGTYKIGGKTYEFGADGKAKVKTSSSTTTHKTTKKTTSVRSSYPDLFNYGYADAGSLVQDNTYDVYGYTYSEDSIDMYGKYLAAWQSAGYTVIFGDTDTYTSGGDVYLYSKATVKYQGVKIAEIFYMESFSSSLKTVTVDYY
ncbi:MAG: fibronectin type III domain-containing protein [Oscillospiraceae bacterium]|nr:fibronectin type III domain-containing protein [Oscillospiraceae bacterium]